ncbi:hypothetical protein CVT26_007907 [Gymnopilus dilepis]|uniref:Uncharacterized protein n=1 Tax=Gymnopilus dilepis TaxID=231916 RepID=A0A409X861_9AGAR|nr:hypothetical protein CVT26_007907 [Gymnopilus dilepis]
MPTTTPTNPPHGQPFPLTPEDTWALEAHALLWLGNPQDLTLPKGPGVECLNPLLQKDPERPILIRKEFSDLWDEISFWAKQIPWSERGVAIWGNPGSGKSLFLRYALARALLAGTPIILCEHPSHLFYFSASGVQRVSLAQINDRGYDLRFDLGLPSPPPIALWDTNLTENPPMPTPHRVFLRPWSLPFFIVQATEVRDAQWRGWVKEWNGRIWLFDAWTEEEVGKL